MQIIAPSILSCDFAHMATEVEKISHTAAQWLHIDIMDGHFVPNLTLGPDVVQAIRPFTSLFFDVHLMVTHPQRQIKQFAQAGAELITFHLEAQDDPIETIGLIHSLGLKAGLSVKPDTPADALLPFLQVADLILVMTVEPGFGGQSFMHEMLGKISALRREIDRCGRSIWLEVDGGINAQTARLVVESGADVLVAGSYVFHHNDYSQAVDSLL